MLLMVIALLFIVSMILQPFCFVVADACIEVLRIPMRFVGKLVTYIHVTRNSRCRGTRQNYAEKDMTYA